MLSQSVSARHAVGATRSQSRIPLSVCATNPSTGRPRDAELRQCGALVPIRRRRRRRRIAPMLGFGHRSVRRTFARTLGLPSWRSPSKVIGVARPTATPAPRRNGTKPKVRSMVGRLGRNKPAPADSARGSDRPGPVCGPSWQRFGRRVVDSLALSAKLGKPLQLCVSAVS